MALDVTLERPDANPSSTITLKVREFSFTGGVAGQILVALPDRNTLGLDLGFRTRTFQVVGDITPGGGVNPLVARENLEAAWLTWWSIGDGQSRLIWGKKSDDSDYDFNVFVKQLQMKWAAKKGRTGLGLVLEVTLVMQEVGVIGALN